MLPDRLSRLYRQLEGKAKGCFLYSEGIYEDFNKAVESQFYLRNAVDWRETARAYGRYELGIADLDAYIRLIELVEKTHTEVATTGKCDPADAEAAYRLGQAVERAAAKVGPELLALAHHLYPLRAGCNPLPPGQRPFGNRQ